MQFKSLTAACATKKRPIKQVDESRRSYKANVQDMMHRQKEMIVGYPGEKQVVKCQLED